MGEDAWKVEGLSTFQLCLKTLLMFCLAYSDVHVLCDRPCLSLFCIKNLLAHLPSVVDRTSPVRKSRLFQWDYGKSITGGLCFRDTSFLIICLQYDLGGWPLG